MEAPASAAPTAASSISAALTGRCGDMDGVWMEPVTAQVTMIFFCFADMVFSGAYWPQPPTVTLISRNTV